jgi:hypothetical protein
VLGLGVRWQRTLLWHRAAHDGLAIQHGVVAAIPDPGGATVVIGPAPIQHTLDPGSSFEPFALDTPVLWQGPLKITPMCGGHPMPPVTLQVQTSLAVPGAATALHQATADTNGAFDSCVPSADGSWVSGSARAAGDWSGVADSFAASCAAWVHQAEGFDLVVLAIVTRPMRGTWICRRFHR